MRFVIWNSTTFCFAKRLQLFLVLLECSCWSSSTRHLGSSSMGELTCSKGWNFGNSNVGLNSSLLASLVEILPSNPNLVGQCSLYDSCWTLN